MTNEKDTIAVPVDTFEWMLGELHNLRTQCNNDEHCSSGGNYSVNWKSHVGNDSWCGCWRCN